MTSYSLTQQVNHSGFNILNWLFLEITNVAIWLVFLNQITLVVSPVFKDKRFVGASKMTKSTKVLVLKSFRLCSSYYLTIQADIVLIASCAGCFWCSLFLRVVRHPQVFRWSSNGSTALEK